MSGTRQDLRENRTVDIQGLSQWPYAIGLLAVVVSLGIVSSAARADDEPPAAAAPAEGAPSGDALAQLPAAHPLALRVQVEKAEAKLAEPFAFVIEVRHTPDEVYELPASLEWTPFHVRDQRTEVKPEGDATTTTLRFALQPFDVGEQHTPAFRLLARSPSGVRQLEIPAQTVKVQGVIDPAQGEPQLREERRPLPRVWRRIWWPLWAAGSAVLLALAVWWLRHRRRESARAAPAKPRPPPYDEAMARLEALEAEALVAKGEKQPFYFRLAELLRDYLGRRYGFDALELTSDELLGELRGRSTPGLDFGALAGFLSAADLVKFARRDPSDAECKAAIDLVRSFVRSTRPATPVGPAAAGEGA